MVGKEEYIEQREEEEVEGGRESGSEGRDTPERWDQDDLVAPKS